MRTRESDRNPLLQGNFAPWRVEGDADDLEVIGQIPDGLEGIYYRNGPNPAFEPIGRYHWFDGDGMIHALRLRGGRASYRNRYVRSEGLLEERRAGRALFPGIVSVSLEEAPRFKTTANTNIVFHAGRLLALVESSLPTELALGTLETIGPYDFGGRLGSPMTAHPKLDPETGEMLFFGYSAFPPYLQFHVADACGRLVRSEAIDVEWPSMMHDFAITREHVVFILCPVVFSFENLMQGKSLFAWEPERGCRIGVMPRSGGNADVRWFATEACYVFHPLNAYTVASELVLDVARYQEMSFMSRDGQDAGSSRSPTQRDHNVARLHRWRLDLAHGGVRSEPLDEGDGEFPRIDERRLGRRHRFGYLAATGPEGNDSLQPVFTAVRKYDLERGSIETRAFGRGNGVGEPLFVPRHRDAAEDDGYLLDFVYDAARNASEFVILDARNINDEPIARVPLPHRVPYGFHGNWVPEAESSGREGR
jgi:carotenoid cleavage dioxygenase-like enzyme